MPHAALEIVKVNRRTVRRLSHVSASALMILLIGLSIARSQTTAPAESKFLRFVQTPDGGRLEASVVTYRNEKGVTLDLVAAVHIADASFFKALDDSFTQYDSVLYEMVKPKDVEPPSTRPTTRPRLVAAATKPTTRHTPSRALNWVGAFQQFLRDKLDLTFQLEQIDYGRPNFVHADLDTETFLELEGQRGESLGSLMLQEMMRQLAEPPAGPQMGVMDILLALQQPDRASALKLLLARQFGQIDELAAGFGDPDASVIIGERNKTALKTLQQRIDAGDKKLAIFYGAAHLKSMEHTLTTQMGFTQVGAPKWRAAWDVKIATTQPTTRALE